MNRLDAVVCLFVVPFTACGKAPSPGHISVTRDQSTSYLAATACDRYDDCQGASDTRRFLSRDACEAEYKARALAHWPEPECADPQIDELAFEGCLSALLRQHCTKDPWEAVNVADCTPKIVCSNGAPPTEPPSDPPAPVATN
jgi:hypothetical protein